MGDLKLEATDTTLIPTVNRGEAWITNRDKKELYSPSSLLYHVLSEMGFHIRFESDAMDSNGKPIESSTALYIDDPGERTKVKRIRQLVSGSNEFRVFTNIYDGLALDFAKTDISSFSEEDRKSLEVLRLKRHAEIREKMNSAQYAKEIKEAREKVEKPETPPYPLQKMRDRIAKMVDTVLAEHKDLAPEAIAGAQ